MKKSITLALLTILMLQAGGLLFVYKIQQWSNYERVHEYLKGEQTLCQRLRLSFRTYQSSKINSREILYEGKMYDIKSVTMLDSLVELTVFHDQEEENILEKIEECIKESIHNKDFPNKLYQFLYMNYLSGLNDYIFFVKSETVKLFGYENLNPIAGDSKASTPPPRLV